MADNVQAEAVVSGGATFATDDNAGVHHPYTKMEWGADGVFTPVSSGASAMPVQDGGNTLTVDGTVTVQDGGSAISVDDNGSTLSVDDGGSTLTVDGTVTTNPQPTTSGGLTPFRSIDLDETEEQVKATAGQIYAVWISNLATTTRFVKFYNDTAANVSVGTTTPVLTLPIPGNTNDDTTLVSQFGGMGVVFDTAITVAATTGVADNDTGAPGANEVIVNIFYK